MSRVKRKLVLGISHLSVAMLGASLLVANPVSAEEGNGSPQVEATVVTTQGGSETSEQQISQETSQEASKKTSPKTAPGVVIELIEEGENGEERILYSTQDPYFKGRDDGYNAGYRDGQKEDAPENPTNVTPELSTNPYTTSGDQGKSVSYSDGYQDAYALGYRDGWDNKHYIWSTFKRMWYWFTGLFYSSSTR
ncbi:UNVERIFIED_CONTAM: hypothetical protein KB581_00570 [Streptococcus canis]|uniref:Uncharacterized protein n=1 Tax=Streptococcus canis TaxID=1329 RepID=A0AAE4Q4G6_STRCB|nr:hypothetical protein [Streptococcus canis]MDV5976163.1 hypothetical protein [Streptococcus canis]